jgi:aspartate aminotransferase
VGMSIDTRAYLPVGPAADAAAAAALTPTIASMQGSMILEIAGGVRALVAAGKPVCNLTVGDFSAQQFPIPTELADRVIHAIRAGETNYPPPDGVPALKKAIVEWYARDLGLVYDERAVVVASGARPPIYAAWRLFVEPGDRTVSFAPSWNVGYYAHLTQANHEFVATTAETDFLPTVEQAAAAMRGARLVVLNSPLNPTGTVIRPEVLKGIAEALVEENRGRARPCMLIFDQVYWMLTAEGVRHSNPVSLVPECAPYVVQVDAISKCFASTGLRLGWAVLPPYLASRMGAFIGHVGAWAPRAEQVATASYLAEPALMATYMDEMRGRVDRRLRLLYDGLVALQHKGLPVRAIAPQGAIYLSVQFDLIGRGFDTNQQITRWLLEEAGVAVVPFQAFDLEQHTGWCRMSIGAVSERDLSQALERIESALARR